MQFIDRLHDKLLSLGLVEAVDEYDIPAAWANEDSDAKSELLGGVRIARLIWKLNGHQAWRSGLKALLLAQVIEPLREGMNARFATAA